MKYYVLANQFDGELIQASSTPLEAQYGQLLIARDGDIPDLQKYEWHPGSLAFIERNMSRFITKYAFVERLTTAELVAIYALAKTDINVVVWLDKFRMVEEVNLDEPELQATLPLFELVGVLAPGRAAEILA